MWCDFIPLQLLYIFSFISYPPQREKWGGGRKEGKVVTDGKREKERERQKTERKRRKRERDKRRGAIYNEH